MIKPKAFYLIACASRRCPSGWLGLAILASVACSLKSLDHLQVGEPPPDSSAGQAGRGGSAGRSGAGGREQDGVSGSSAGGGLGAAGVASDGDGGTTSAMGGSPAGGSMVTSTSLAGASSDALGGAAATSGGSDAQGGKAGLGGTPVTSGGATTGAGGRASSGGASIAGSSGSSIQGGNISAGTNGTGTAGASAGGTGTGGTPVMVYNLPGQSCALGLTCPGSVSCCRQIEVPAGSFSMGTNTDAARNADEAPPHTANLDRFLMDEFEVTVGRFRSFVQAYDGSMPPPGSGAHPKQAASGWQLGFDSNMPVSRSALLSAINCSTGSYQTWTALAGVRETMPMNCVSWYVAYAFCIWDGARLPSEAEWEMVAASGSNDWRFPWGNTDPDPSKHAVMNCLGDGIAGCDPGDLLPVGSRAGGANQWGHLDLAGSLWEWTLDYYDSTYYQAIGVCNNCISLAAFTPRAIRGGNFTSGLNSVRATGRASKTPVTADPYAGFRCVKSP